MTPGLSIAPPAPLTMERRARTKPVLRFDVIDDRAARRARIAADVRFFATSWAMAFVLFYSFLF